MHGLLALSLLPLLASAAPALNTETIHQDAAPLLSSINAETVPDSYIVVFKKHVTESSAANHHSWVQDVHLSLENERTELRKRSQFPFATDIFAGLKHTYNIGGEFLGYSGHFDESVIEQVRRHPDVEYVERDSIVRTIIQDSTTDEDYEKQLGAPWGLARISHREKLKLTTFNEYLYASDGGECVDVYVVDTGIYTEHVDFEDRAEWGKTFVPGDEDVDGNGHGTHCAGTIAGKKYGVAKKANVIAVKVLDARGAGSMSDVVKGVEFVGQSHIKKVDDPKARKGKCFKGSTANMSLGGAKSSALDAAVNSVVSRGVHFAVAAGNDNQDCCNYSPAASERAITVGASTLFDERAYFSNFGTCLDVFGPGLNILSTWIGSKYAVNTISGTSMASPHIAGLLAYYLSLQPSSESAYAVAEITPKKLKDNLISIATVGALTGIPEGTKNILAWNGGGSSNFSAIINAGGHSIEKDSQPSVNKPLTFDDLKVIIEESLDIDSAEVVNGAKSSLSKVKEITQKMNKIMDEELEELFG